MVPLDAQEPCSHLQGKGARAGNHVSEPARALLRVVGGPEVLEGQHELQAEDGVVLLCPVECASDVVPVGQDELVALRLLALTGLRGQMRCLGDRERTLGVATADDNGVCALIQSLGGELADRLEHRHGRGQRRGGDEGMRAIAKRGEHVWLVTNETENPSVHAQALDLSIGRLYPPHSYESIRKAGEWEKLHPFEEKRVDVEKMLVGIEVMPSQADVLDGFNMAPATTA